MRAKDAISHGPQFGRHRLTWLGIVCWSEIAVQNLTHKGICTYMACRDRDRAFQATKELEAPRQKNNTRHQLFRGAHGISRKSRMKDLREKVTIRQYGVRLSFSDCCSVTLFIIAAISWMKMVSSLLFLIGSRFVAYNLS